MTRKNKPPMVRHMPLTKARINLGAVVKQVHLNKEYVVLEKDGIPIAALMDAEEFEDYLELKDPEVKRHIAASTKEYREGKSFPAEDLIAESEEKGEAGRGRRR
jgi:PHD/YefM family antitoxin component YafN of YafNO toxin-antitoxin module